MKTVAIRILLPAALLGAYYAASGPASPVLKPYSVQMHVHGSMSEGAGSMRGANIQAKKLGLEVLWWSDHDWRMAYHTYPSSFDFESDELSATVPTPYAAGTDPAAVQGDTTTFTLAPAVTNGRVADTIARMTNQRASQGTRSFEIAARAGDAAGNTAPAAARQPAPPRKRAAGDEEEDGPPRPSRPSVYGDYQPFFYTLAATRQTAKRSLASKVQMKIAMYPDLADARDGMAAVRVDLSQQPPDFAPGVIFYVATALTDADLHRLETPHAKFVKVNYKNGTWNDLTLNLTDDARRLGLGGEDNAMVSVSFGVLTRGNPADAFFDDLRITHQIQSEALRAEARKMAAALQKEYGVVNYVGQEFSYLAHMNPLGENVPMIDHVKFPHGLNQAQTAEFAHRYNAVISLNHIFGTSRPPRGLDPDDPASVRTFEDRRIQELTESNVYGADLLEVGYPNRVLPMTSFLRVWDSLSNNGVYVLGNGISDTHSSTNGWFDGNNFVSWVWAESLAVPDLVAGLRRGELYFGDLHRFKGQLRLTTEDGHRMGQVVRTAKASHSVTYEVAGLPAGVKIRTVIGGRVADEFTAASADIRKTVNVETAARTFFRVEAYMPDGRPLVFSNPIQFVPAGENPKVAAARRVECR